MDSKTLVNIGEQRFDRLIEQERFYIDKTNFIKEWWETSSTVTLITRPRRFGKTLNMSMLECFFSIRYAERSDLFEGLSIWEEEKYRQLQGTFPVIFLSFANVKASNYADMEYCITKVISDLYEQNRYLFDKVVLSDNEREYYGSVKPGMDGILAAGAIHSMACFMQRYYKKDVIIILDEYDTPMHEAWINGYWDQAVEFFRKFFNSTFKTNPFLYRGMITGITRISNVSLREPSESIFSDLNNLNVITTTSDEYATAFGFTEEEVFQALDDMGLGAEKQEVKRWYDGFTFGEYTDIYNPWSISSFIAKKGKYDAYWANTSGNGLVNSLIRTGNADLKQTMEMLLQGKSFVTELDEQIVYDQLDDDDNAVWSLLLAAGYLKIVNLEYVGIRKTKTYTLTITNMETLGMFENMVKGWFKGSVRIVYNEFIKAMLNDNVRMMNAFMNKVALNTFSSFDSGNKPSEETEPERFYHGFVLGMVVNLADTYKVRSNRESGYGRYDVMLKPLDRSGKAFIFEFKVLNPYEDEETLEETLANAHYQIEEKKYEAELISEGFAPEQIRKYGFAFQGKTCLIG
ncbi:MAG: ATP-binding protein [Lachnospiraceae bacterium]